jgi:hypothetical protein
MDLDFIAQFLQLRHLAEDARLMGLGPLTVLGKLAASRRIDPASGKELIADYVWMRRLERRARLLFGNDRSDLPAGGEKLQALEHAWEAYKIADELAAAKVGISVFADSWAYKMEAAEGIAYDAGYCAKKGVLVSINSDSGERIRRLFNEAGKSMKYGGLTENEALSLITINPAIQLGVEKIVGSLEVGKQGDIAIFNEHPMSAYTRCEMTIIEGDIYFDRAEYLKDREEADKKAQAPKKGGRP